VTRSKPKRRATKLEPDRGTPELRQHHTLVEEGTRESRMGGRAEPHMRVVDQWPLDRYHHRGELAPGQPERNQILWRAGDRLRIDWAMATGEPLKAARLERQDRGPVRAADTREDARRAFRSARRAVGTLHTSVLVHVVCQGHSARDWAHRTARRPRRGLPALRLALAELARHYRMPVE
jgi:hypothetical protein